MFVVALFVLVDAASTGVLGDLVALLVGVNVGPNLVTVGSLATLLWLTVLRDHGLAPSPLRFVREGLVVVPATLAAGLGVLELTTGG